LADGFARLQVMTREAVVVGAGPNGLVGALVLAREGWKVRVLEADDQPGGGVRTEELTLPGFAHDVCSAVHPMALASKALTDLKVEWVHPDAPLAHPLDGGRAMIVERSVDDTAAGFGEDGPAYRKLMGPLAEGALSITGAVLSPRRVPRPSAALVDYGKVGVRSATGLARARFDTDGVQALFSGMAAHSILPLDAPLTAGVGLLLGLLAHAVGWPIARGGSQAIADALVAELEAAGAEIQTGVRVKSLDELGSPDAVMLDLTPAQVLIVGGDRLPRRYQRALKRYRYGPGVCKVDWALDGPIPWSAPEVGRAGTVHVGGSLEEIAAAEADPHAGRHADRPFILLAQPTLADPTRAPAGQHIGWAYCHVPAGSTEDRSEAIEAQVERFAPGFRDRIIGRHVLTAAAVEARDPNRVGGDIGGGVADWRQLLVRPTLTEHPWVTPVKGLYLCSSATPPGGGVHGMCGWHAARAVLRKHH
jgi:phytoene dehydrogenase-like protein